MASYPPLKQLNKDELLRTVNNLLKLRKQLDRDIPQKTATDTLLLATWNIREFGDNRRAESLHYIAEIICRFDLVAVQEVSSNLTGLDRLKGLLGPNWDYIATDATDGSAVGGERIAFLYDKNKVFFRRIAGEITLAQDKLIGKDKLQFARTPYSIALQAGWFKFVLNIVHIFYGTESKDDLARRKDETTAIASILSQRAKDEDVSYILLGDFNVSNLDDTMNVLATYGFKVPDSIKAHPSDLGGTSHYDQIAFNLKLKNGMTIFSEKEQKAGAFNFAETIYTENDVDTYKDYFPEAQQTKTEEKIKKYFLSKWRTFQISDHLPLWVELKIDFSNQYLAALIK